MTKRITFLFLSFLTLTSVHAQEQEVGLKEVTVTAASVVNKPYGQLIIPEQHVLESARNGYDLLTQLSLKGIQVDEDNHTVKSPQMLGEVQVRINGIVVKQSDMQSLDPKLVKNISFVTRPGVRYGQGIAYVIDINTRRSDAGWVVGTDLRNTLTSLSGDNEVYAKRNVGRSEWTVDYDNSYSSTHNRRQNSYRNYLLSDGTIYKVVRKDLATRNRTFGQYWQLKYNWADSTRTIFQADFDVNYSHTPGNYRRYLLTDGETNTYNVSNKSHSWIPSLDLYLSHQFSDTRSLTANATLTTIGSDEHREMDEGGLYAYNVDGRMRSLMSEVVYSAQLKSFTWSAGAQLDWKYTRNAYSGDVDALNGLHQSTLYLFSDISGTIKNLYYQLGLGASRFNYSQDEHHYARWFFRPKMTLSYSLSESAQLYYYIEHSQQVSRIAMVNDTRIRQNSMEWTVGNPDIHASSRLEQQLGLSLSGKRWSNDFSINARLNHRPNMAHYERTNEDQFIYYQRNQGHINMFYAMNYTELKLIPTHLTLTMNHSLFRFMNKADNYSHNLTFYNVTGSLRAYLGKWTISYAADNGWKFVEGENLGRNQYNSTLRLAYRWKNCNASLSWSHPFEAHPGHNYARTLNRYVSGRTDMTNSNMGNRLTLNFSWRLNRGRRYQNIERKEARKDTDDGILR